MFYWHSQHSGNMVFDKCQCYSYVDTFDIGEGLRLLYMLACSCKRKAAIILISSFNLYIVFIYIALVKVACANKNISKTSDYLLCCH